MSVRLLLGGKTIRRIAAAVICVSIISGVAAPNASPARGDGPVAIAVGAFQNEAGAPANVVSDLSNAAYRAIASSNRYTAKGGGPLPNPSTLTADPFVAQLQEAAKAGADELLSGSVVQAGGGQVYYRLSLYRVAPLTFIGSQIFSQPYPATDPNALTAGFGANVATIAAPRQAIGTIYSTVNGAFADTGSIEGFYLGDRFNVMRNGQKMAEATISSITDDYATLTISNAAPGYKPAVGDTVVGVRALPAVQPAPPTHSSFTALGFLAAVGGVLLAIGHHGQPARPGGSIGTPPPSTQPFTVQPQTIQVNLPQATFPFLFSNPLSAQSITNIPGLISYVQVNTQMPGSQATTPPQTIVAFCNCQVQFTNVTGPTGNPESQMQFTATGLVANEIIFFNFFPTITDQNGNTLQQPAFFQTNPLLIIKRSTSIEVGKPGVGPVAPGPPVPGVPKPVGPKGPPPANPKPGPNDPHIPH